MHRPTQLLAQVPHLLLQPLQLLGSILREPVVLCVFQDSEFSGGSGRGGGGSPSFLFFPFACQPERQGLTLVRFSAQPEPFLTRNTP